MKRPILTICLVAGVAALFVTSCMTPCQKGSICELHGCPMRPVVVPLEYRKREMLDADWYLMGEAERQLFPHAARYRLIVARPIGGPDAPPPPATELIYVCPKCTEAGWAFIKIVTVIKMDPQGRSNVLDSIEIAPPSSIRLKK